MQFNSNSIECKLHELNINFGQKLATICANDMPPDVVKSFDDMRTQLDDYKKLMSDMSDESHKVSPNEPKKSYADVIHNRDQKVTSPTTTTPPPDVSHKPSPLCDQRSAENLGPNASKKCINSGNEVKKKRIPLQTTPLKTINGNKRDNNDSIISVKSDFNRQKQLRRDIEQQFFGSHLPSLKETVDFVSDRITSKCIRRIKNDVYVKCKQSYNESIAINDNHFNASEELDLNCITNAIQSKCNDFVDEYCMATNPQIEGILPLLVIEDIDKSVCDFAAKMATKLAIDKCMDWVDANITQALIEKDLKIQMKKKMLNRHKCPEPTTGQHMPTIIDITPTFSAVRDLMGDLYKRESMQLEGSRVVHLMDELSHLRRQSNILPKRTLDFIDVNIVDFAMALIANTPDCLNETVVQRFVDYWLEFKVTVEKYICPRNLFILSERSRCALKSWNKYETFLLKLLSNGITNYKIIESDCLWTLKQEWSDETLNRLASCLKSVTEHHKPMGRVDDSEFTESHTIEWLSWFCSQCDQ